MAGYIEVGEVRTWYDEHGEGEPVVLLHPGGVDARACGPTVEAVAAQFRVFTPERRGHGHTQDVNSPIRFELLVFIAGVFHRDGWAPGVLDADAAPPEFLARLYGEVSPDGAAHYPAVVAELDRMHAQEPTLTVADLNGVSSRTLVMVGDDDEVILEHAVALYRGLPDGELAVVPGTSHGLLIEKPMLCNTIIVDFLSIEPVRTMAPIRRA
jgi:pimeloyl-ACP methyl ester carboxylesterase